MIHGRASSKKNHGQSNELEHTSGSSHNQDAMKQELEWTLEQRSCHTTATMTHLL